MKPKTLVAALLVTECGVFALACNYAPAYTAYYRAAVAYYGAGNYAKAYDGALEAAHKISICVKTDDPTQPLTQEEKALWASYLAAAADTEELRGFHREFRTAA